MTSTNMHEDLRDAVGDALPPIVTYQPGVGLVAMGKIHDDPEVLREAAHWVTGERGVPVPIEELAGADLAPYTRVALSVAARVLPAAANTTGLAELTGAVAQLADRAEAAGAALVADASRATVQVVETTVDAARKVTEETAALVDNARKRVEAEMGQAIDKGTVALTDRLSALLDGEDASVVQNIRTIVGEALAGAQVAWQSTLATTLTQVASTLDAGNPSSPLNALEQRLRQAQADHHRELADRLERVQDAVGAATHAAETAAAVAAIEALSPRKGKPFEHAVGEAVERIACGMGASYADTADIVGAVRGSKKGDGVLEAQVPQPGWPVARVVLEYTTTGAPRNWNAYLGESERNREAHASLGVVPQRGLVPGGELVAILADNRMVVAFDPETDDESILRAAIQIMALQAVRRVCDGRTGELGTVDARIAQAKQALMTMQDLVKTATAVRNGATKIVSGMESLFASLTQILDQAHAALRDATSAA